MNEIAKPNAVIFGIDAGLTAPGFAVVDLSTGGYGTVLLAECFIPDVSGEGKTVTDFNAQRIGCIVNRILAIYLRYKPGVVVAELPTGGSKSGQAARGMAFSVAMTVSALASIKTLTGDRFQVCYITPHQNKKGAASGGKVVRDEGQSKWEVLTQMQEIWKIDWPHKKRKSLRHELDDGKCFAIADALSTIATYLRRDAKLLTGLAPVPANCPPAALA